MERPWGCETLNDLEAEPTNEGWVGLLGVVGTPPLLVVVVREERADKAVGPLINDFFGVSATSFRRLRVDDDKVDFTADGGGLDRLPEATNGCRIAVCGFRRLSGSQTRHFEMKSTNSSSLHRKT